MEITGAEPSSYGLHHHGLRDLTAEFWNLGPAALVEQGLARAEGLLTHKGAFVTSTGQRTGRSPKDKFIVDEPTSSELVDWNKINIATSPEVFDAIHQEMVAYAAGKDVFVRDCYVGADPTYRMAVRVVSEYAWHNLFACNLFIRPQAGETRQITPEFTILCFPGFRVDATRHNLHSEAVILLSFERQMVLIGGTRYAGEIKKSIFTIMNHLLPQRDVLPMHCSANIGRDQDVALFFGLSGTGKTTLSADPQRGLIGDDEHGWSASGVFNFEGGCYAKCIRLSEETEPQIFHALRFASILENVIIDEVTRVPDFDDDRLTENTRAAYPIDYIDNAVHPSHGGHPKNVVFLTCDAFGVLPPICKLTKEQAMYHFLSGYTAKVAGTEAGVTEPQATFSTLFGAPFFTQKPITYADLLGERLDQHNTRCWLVNTGWSGGPYGVGKRMKLPYTRAMLNAALDGRLSEVEYVTDKVFGLKIPTSAPDVPKDVMIPRKTWKDPTAYDDKARQLAGLFRENFQKIEGASPGVTQAGPQ